MAVFIPTGVTAITDAFIGDLFLDTPENRKRQPHAVPLAFHVVNRPHTKEAEPIPRCDNLSPSKLAAEGTRQSYKLF